MFSPQMKDQNVDLYLDFSYNWAVGTHLCFDRWRGYIIKHTKQGEGSALRC